MQPPRPPSRQQRAVAEATAREHTALLEAIHRLEAALTSPVPRREAAWRDRVRQELAQVLAKLEEHCAAAERPGGLVAELEAAQGRLPELRLAAEEHRTLPEAVQGLLACLQQPDARPPGHGELRRELASLMNRLRAHQAREADLIFDAFWLDIGAGD
ncbi:MAG TPA: hemerythrin domain-containing protein [Dehalococcoidia bacterium]